MCGMLGFVGDNVLGNVQATVSARACVVGSGGGRERERSGTYLIYDVIPQSIYHKFDLNQAYY